mmetsp:Transcript_1262/g.2900  ORF Transcript_1262/g.2900 Transcript_1262/m.2900 type:complete len:95 (-) Transcript_1262:409-693(-)
MTPKSLLISTLVAVCATTVAADGIRGDDFKPQKEQESRKLDEVLKPQKEQESRRSLDEVWKPQKEQESGRELEEVPRPQKEQESKLDETSNLRG